jgi:hypothetical protein
MRRACIVASLLALSGCSMPDSVLYSSPAPEPEPPYRQIISENMSAIFVASAGARDYAVSGARHVATLPGKPWFVCLRARFAGRDGEDLGTRTYVVRIEKDRIIDRRLAEPDDGCDRETFEKLTVPHQASGFAPSPAIGGGRP